MTVRRHPADGEQPIGRTLRPDLLDGSGAIRNASGTWSASSANLALTPGRSRMWSRRYVQSLAPTRGGILLCQAFRPMSHPGDGGEIIAAEQLAKQVWPASDLNLDIVLPGSA